MTTAERQAAKTLPQAVIEEDHALEGREKNASEALARHRWHWTLDETNPERVSLREYARRVGRDHDSIRRYAQGYADWQGGDQHVATLGEMTERAGVSAEKEAVTDAIAKARGLTFITVNSNRRTEVRQVRAAAKEVAERKGTTVAEEAPRIAQAVVREEERRTQERDKAMADNNFRWIDMEGNFEKARDWLAKNQRLAGQVRWDDEEKELLRYSIEKIRRVLLLIEARIAGVEEKDWDAELANIMEGAA